MNWNEQDFYFKKAKRENYLSRSVYKLKEIDQKFKIMEKGDKILDLGCAPGAWIQYARKQVGKEGMVLGIDIKPADPKLYNCQGVKLLQKNAFDLKELSDLEMNSRFNCLLSDMAPKTTGMSLVDQAKSFDLVKMVFGIITKFLEKKGHLTVKAFDSPEIRELVRNKQKFFQKLKFFKTKATRHGSKEIFIIGKGYVNEN